jgi:cytochrome c551/c552
MAGEPYTLNLVVRQHGVHPLAEADVTAILRSPVDGQEQVLTAQPAKAAGHYLLDVRFAQPGRWTVEVQPGGFPPVLLTAYVVASQQPEAGAAAAVWWWPVVPVALAAGYVTRRARRGVVWQMAVAALVAGSTFALLGWSQAQTVSAAPTQVEVGHALFSAKGCVTCHRHDQVETLWSTEMGPNLTNYAMDPDWLARWLADPAGVRPQTPMPDLELSPGEIEALSAFLLAE